jgi:hypothetical protein
MALIEHTINDVDFQYKDKIVSDYSGIIILINRNVDFRNDHIYELCERIINSAEHHPILIVVENDTSIQFTDELITYEKMYFQSFGPHVQIVFINSKNIEIAYNIHNIVSKEIIKFQDLMDEKRRIIARDVRGITSRDYPEYLLIEQFNNATLSSKIWTHYNKLRIIHFAIMKYGIKKTLESDSWLFTKWRALIIAKNWNERFHNTKIKFWCRYIYDLLDTDSYSYSNMEILAQKHPEIENETLIYDYYIKNDLDNDNAHDNWVPPTIRSFKSVISGHETSAEMKIFSKVGCLIS